jgi:hypothetical protein
MVLVNNKENTKKYIKRTQKKYTNFVATAAAIVLLLLLLLPLLCYHCCCCCCQCHCRCRCCCRCCCCCCCCRRRHCCCCCCSCRRCRKGVGYSPTRLPPSFSWSMRGIEGVSGGVGGDEMVGRTCYIAISRGSLLPPSRCPPAFVEAVVLVVLTWRVVKQVLRGGDDVAGSELVMVTWPYRPGKRTMMAMPLSLSVVVVLGNEWGRDVHWCIPFPSLYSCPLLFSLLLFVVSSSLSLGGDVAVVGAVSWGRFANNSPRLAGGSF